MKLDQFYYQMFNLMITYADYKKNGWLNCGFDFKLMVQKSLRKYIIV